MSTPDTPPRPPRRRAKLGGGFSAVPPTPPSAETTAPATTPPPPPAAGSAQAQASPAGTAATTPPAAPTSTPAPAPTPPPTPEPPLPAEAATAVLATSSPDKMSAETVLRALMQPRRRSPDQDKTGSGLRLPRYVAGAISAMANLSGYTKEDIVLHALRRSTDEERELGDQLAVLIAQNRDALYPDS